MKPKTMVELPMGIDPEEIDDADVLVDVDESADSPGYTEEPDGSVLIDTDKPKEPRNPEFEENLADVLEESVLGPLGIEYDELVENDIKTRERRDKQYAEGIKRTGMGDKAPGGADFDGASRAAHPMLTKGCIDFASRAIKELMPPTGPCKTQIIGEQTEDKLDRAERKRQYMNWQSTTQIEENRSELEKLLSQVPLAGAQYKRWWWDFELRRPRTEAVFIDNVFTPYGHSDFYTSPRVTHRQRILRTEYDSRIRTGLYRDLNLPENSLFGMEQESEAQTATDKVEGVDPDAVAMNEDGLRTVYQIEVQLTPDWDELVDEGRSAPYVMHLDKESKRVLGLYRNWRENDDRYRKKHWMTEWPFIPWRDGPAVGLAHIIGTLAGAATGAVRALLDSALIQNFPGGLMMEGGKTPGQSIQVDATQFVKVTPPAGVTDPDIRKLAMAFPFNGPSAVLFNLLEWLTQQGEAVVATASEKIADAKGDMPVGTALALIEHGSANFSAIHSRLHAAMKRDLEIQHRLNSEYMSDRETVEDLGELVVSRTDFGGPMDIIPVSDPNIFSETQRFAQLQAVMQLKADPQFAQFFKPDQLLARALKLLQVSDPDSIATLPGDAKKLGGVEENYAAASADDARPLKAYTDQDHVAHLKIHIQFATSPMFGANPLMAGGVMTKMLQHCKEHILMLYEQHTKASIDTMKVVAKAQGMKVSPDEIQLMGAAFAEQVMAQILGPMIMPGLQKMQEIVDQISKASAPKASPEVQLVEETKMKLKDMELKAKASENEKDRQANAGAADIAARAELAALRSQEDLARLTTNVELIRDQQNNGAKQLMAEFQANANLQQSIITEVLNAALAQVQAKAEAQAADTARTVDELGQRVASLPAPPSKNDLADELLAPLLGAVQSQMAEALGGMSNSELMNSVQALALQYQNLEQILQSERETNSRAIVSLAQGMKALSQQVNQPTEAEIYIGPDGRKRARRVPAPQPMQPQLTPPQGPQQ